MSEFFLKGCYHVTSQLNLLQTDEKTDDRYNSRDGQLFLLITARRTDLILDSRSAKEGKSRHAVFNTE